MLGTLRKIFAFAGNRQELLKTSLFFSLLNGIFASLQFGALYFVISALAGERSGTSALWLALGMMLLSIVGRIGCSIYSMNQQTEVGYGMVADQRIAIGERLKAVPMGYFNDNTLGALSGTVTTTLSDVESMAPVALVNIIGGFCNALMLVLFLAIFSLPLGLTALVGVLIYLLITELATRRSTANASTRQSAQRSLVEAVLEYIQGMSVVKSFGMEADSTRSINAAIDESARRNLRLVTSVAPFIALQQLIVRAASALLLAETLWLHAQGAISLVHAVLFVVLSFMVFGSLESAGSQITMLQTLAASIDTANAALDTPVLDTSGRAITPASSDIAFEDVSFAYVAEDGSRRQILDHVRFTIPANSTTAIVGPSGSGKTTLCHLIARFWDVDAGRITIGGHDVRAFTLESLMANISMVFQNVYLFADTIENNIRFGVPTASRKAVIAAAKRACCHDFIMQLPDGYDTVIGESGATLSGGERQRISIARALLKDASIIILDEATASVDPENEAELQQAIEALTRRKTVIMIAHRLNTVRHADQILVLNNTHIVQQGTHDDLIRQPGLYRDFVNARATANRWTLGEA